jgi:hypothetical protein
MPQAFWIQARAHSTTFATIELHWRNVVAVSGHERP